MFLKRLTTLVIGFLSLYIGHSYYYYPSEETLPDPICPTLKSPRMSKNLKALVLGASGGIGKSIVKALASCPDFDKVTLIGRRKIDLPTSTNEHNYAKFTQEVLDFGDIPQGGALFRDNFDVGFYAIGVSTTKVSEAEYRKIELDNALALAALIKEGGCDNLHWVTGQGTDKNSWFLFGKVKGQVEEEVGKMGFKRVTFYRPAGVLTSDNSGMVAKTFTAVFKAVDVGRWMTVEADLLGKVMVANSLKEVDNKVEIFENSRINRMGKAGYSAK